MSSNVTAASNRAPILSLQPIPSGISRFQRIANRIIVNSQSFLAGIQQVSNGNRRTQGHDTIREVDLAENDDIEKMDMKSISSEELRTPFGSVPTTEPISSNPSPELATPVVFESRGPSPKELQDVSRGAVKCVIAAAISNVTPKAPGDNIVVVGFNRNSPDMEVTRISSYRSYSLEEEITMNLQRLESTLKSPIDDLSYRCLSMLKSECQSLERAIQNLPETSGGREQMVADLERLYSTVCSYELRKKLNDLGSSIENLVAQQGTGPAVIESIKKLQADCKEIYGAAKEVSNRSEIEDECHVLYMRLFDVIRQATSDSACRRSLSIFASAYRSGAQSVDLNELSKVKASVSDELGILSMNNPHIPEGKEILFKKEAAYNDGKGKRLTTEEKQELQAISRKLYWLNEYEEGVKKFLEFRGKVLGIYATVDEVVTGCSTADRGIILEKKLRQHEFSIEYMRKNREMVSHISLQELDRLSSRVKEARKVLAAQR